MLEENPDFYEEFKRVFNSDDTTEADDFTLEVIEYTCMDM